ncbi:putative major facilitator superfamily transporter [Rhodococcus wratislaviensis NBRC 100605]|uniref:Putative major facilitator superfamily transporter n=1 Tax=Rhodococcus wratislaviensis NBRC 100605 TaxID=1219028 RepID=X0PU08_RHOWR|nr:MULTISPECIES: MFS transporter [Rhodococcus]WAM17231.1 MFS transporter [Rhodococcus sp. JS3073]GAF46619.1 putative major facilitator superfamily transporter [Rhodococcus wratislaviensis NBRC 100605]
MTTLDAPEAPPTSRPALRRGAAFTLVAVVIATLLGASAAPTPLYEVYQANWGFSSLQSTLVFGIYAVSLLLALLTVGSLSDYVGRRPVLITALVFEAASMIMFATAEGIGLLLFARVVQGFATGAAISALGSTLLDLERTPGRGATVNSIAPTVGLALGAIGSSLISEHLPRPTSTVFLVFCALFLVEILGIWAAPETAVRQKGALASMRPALAVPSTALGMLVLTGPCLVAVWALGGFYLSLGPSLARNALDVHTSLVGAIMVATLTGTGALAVFLLRNVAARRILYVGASALVAGVAITLIGAETSSALWILAGTAVAGIGFGAGFQGTIRTVMPLAEPHERAGLLSSIYVIAYLANSVPALIAGYLVGKVGLVDTTRIYGGLVIVLAAAAFLGLLVRKRL